MDAETLTIVPLMSHGSPLAPPPGTEAAHARHQRPKPHWQQQAEWTVTTSAAAAAAAALAPEGIHRHPSHKRRDRPLAGGDSHGCKAAALEMT